VANWRFVLGVSSTMEPIAELDRATSRTLSYALNRAGTCSFSLRLTDPVAELVEPISRCIIIYRNGDIVWAGPVWTTDEQAAANTFNVNAVEWQELLGKRFLPEDVTYTDIDAGAIAIGLLQRVNAIAPTLITPGDTEVTRPRSKAYTKDQNLGDEIQTLGDIESGFDYRIDPKTRRLNIYTHYGTDKPKVVFGLGFGPDNLSEATRQLDGSLIVNREQVVGSLNARALVEDFESQLIYGVQEEISTLSDVPDMNILFAYGAAEVAVKRIPRTSISLTPKPPGSAHLPRPFDDYFLGDTVRLGVKRGRFKIPASGSALQAIRIFALSISIDDNGIERVSQIQTTYSGG
jgi:hypothetical protein